MLFGPLLPPHSLPPPCQTIAVDGLYASLDLEVGAGETTVDLTGDCAHNFDASIEGVVGEATVLMPTEVGVRAEGGLGKINAEGFPEGGRSVRERRLRRF